VLERSGQIVKIQLLHSLQVPHKEVAADKPKSPIPVYQII